MTRVLIAVLSWLVPPSERLRWREEWLAEMHQVARLVGSRRSLGVLAGAIPDALAVRRLTVAAARRPRRPFLGLDQDVRYGVRSILGARSYAIGIIGSLGIGIAATAVAFSVVNATFLKPFPGVRDQHELVRVDVRTGQFFIGSSYDEYLLLKNNLPGLNGLLATHHTEFAISIGAETFVTSGAIVSGNYFEVLGLRPARGRGFAPDEDAAAWQKPAVIVSHDFWTRRLGADPNAVNRTLAVNGAELAIVGVAPRDFVGVHSTSHRIDLWTTFATSDLALRNREGRPVHIRDAEFTTIAYVGRRAESVMLEEIQAQAKALAPAIDSMRPPEFKNAIVTVSSLWVRNPARMGADVLGFMALPMIVLAIACVNAGNLLLARATQRSGDWLVRLAIGATRWRLIRQLLVESLLLAVAGATLGAVLCYWALAFIPGADSPIPFVLDAQVLTFTVAVAFATALVFGLGPALSVTRPAAARSPQSAGIKGGAFGSRTRFALVVLQAALCLGLLATGGQFARTVNASLGNDGLTDPEHLLAVEVDVDKARYTRAQSDEFYRQLQHRVSTISNVRAIAFTKGGFWGAWSGDSVRVWLPGEAPDQRRGSLAAYAGGDLFGVLNLSMLQGRTFTDQDRVAEPRVVVVNEPFAKKVLGGDALGRVLRISRGGRSTFENGRDVTVVGVVAAPSAHSRSRNDLSPTLYYPSPLAHLPAQTLYVRFDGDAVPVAAAIRDAVTQLDNRVPIKSIATGYTLRAERMQTRQTLALIITGLGTVALFLAAVGLYGVVSYMVTMRRREIGIRLALGAGPGTVRRMVVRQSVSPAIIGCVVGAGGAAAVGQMIRSQMYGVSAIDPTAFAASTLVLLLTMIVASVAPARRAARVDPIEVLRTE